MIPEYNHDESRAVFLKSVFLLVSSSEKMAGHKIEAFNEAMCKTIKAIGDMQRENVDEWVRLNVLEINDKAQWHIYEFNNGDNHAWHNLTPYGESCIGKAFLNLNEKLTRKNGGFLQAHLNNIPVIILVIDGSCKEYSKYEFEILNKNEWFQHSGKAVLTIDCGGDSQIVSDFIQNTGPVHHVKDFLAYIIINNIMNSMIEAGMHVKEFPCRESDIPDVLPIPEQSSTENEKDFWATFF